MLKFYVNFYTGDTSISLWRKFNPAVAMNPQHKIVSGLEAMPAIGGNLRAAMYMGMSLRRSHGITCVEHGRTQGWPL
ncbi:MAG: hypothetical protein VR64_23675 [Desulfatitalea sp. BRH_c12]|nr:MAG: hypothetical protein VR64_23675 [Desulfatitalea sp. BRH_c12]